MAFETLSLVCDRWRCAASASTARQVVHRELDEPPATVAPKVPANTRIIARMLKNAAGEVPSIMAAPRMPTMPMAVAAFTIG
jgi:hypothetical protein